MGFIYILRNKINDKLYIGQTSEKRVERRIKNHISKAIAGDNKQKIHKAIRKYGPNNFEKYYIECKEEDLDYLEIELIKRFNSIENGYNLDSGGNNQKHRSAETKNKMKEWYRNHDHPALGKKMSEETKEKIRKALLGEKNPFYGKKHKVETKKIISQKTKILANMPENIERSSRGAIKQWERRKNMS